jgi:fermentation-respiration switch protein FrsA (DUF1100 family)
MTSDQASPPARPAKRSLARRLTWQFVRIVVGVYLGLAMVLAGCQTHFIFPGAATQGRADSMVRPIDGGEVLQLRARAGERVAALFGTALAPDGRPLADSSHRPTIIFFYGNGMCLADCTGDWMKWRRRGFNVIVPDYIGYGMSGGKPSEQGVYATADACFDALLQRNDIDPQRIVPLGWSLGGAAAVHLASTRKVPCLVLVSAFTSMDAMAHHIFPYLPTSLFLRHHFKNEQKLRCITAPVFIAHGTRDSIVPFDMSNQNAKACAGPVTKYDVPGGDHNDVFDVGGAPMRDAIASFIDAHAGAASTMRGQGM